MSIKALGRAIRIAALLELVARADDGRPLKDAPISGWAMRGAIDVCRALTAHALSVYSDIQADGPTALLRYVLDRACAMPHGGTLRDLYRRCQGRTGIESMEDLVPLVDQLSKRRCLRLRERPPTGGRSGSPVVEIHPDLRRQRWRGERDTSDRTPLDRGEVPSFVTSVTDFAEGADDPTVILGVAQ